MSTDVEHVSQAFRDLGLGEPAGVWAAPGRVNLIGEHTDYNDGFVLPFALPQRVTVAAGHRADGRWSVRSLNKQETVEFGRGDLKPGMGGWAAYVAGVVWALVEEGHDVPGADLVLTSDVPGGAGLSSSAALECAVLTALADLGGVEIRPLRRAQLAQRCENVFVGAPTGLMDQAASILCTDGHALALDCRNYALEQVPLDLEAARLSILVVDTLTPHALVDGAYADRRASCEAAAEILRIPALRDIDDLGRSLARLPDDQMRRRVRHVVTENARVQGVIALLRQGRLDAIGPLLDASHASMRDDYAITVPTVDLAVETARSAGALGARMTGGGFGGCIIALVRSGEADRVAKAVVRALGLAGFGPPAAFTVRPSTGARRLR